MIRKLICKMCGDIEYGTLPTEGTILEHKKCKSDELGVVFCDFYYYSKKKSLSK